jgi:hypothetical protein
LDYTVDDIWLVIGLCHAGVVPAYSDFTGVMDVYRAAGGDSCAVVADMKGAANNKPCGVRNRLLSVHAGGGGSLDVADDQR